MFKINLIILFAFLILPVFCFSQGKIDIEDETLNTLYSDPKHKIAITDNPDWRSIQRKLNGRYNDSIAKSAISYVKMEFYHNQKNWQLFTPAFIDYANKYMKLSSTTNENLIQTANNYLWYLVFKNIKDKRLLKKASTVGFQIINNPNLQAKPSTRKLYYSYVDTYANLLYKAGKVRQALALETQIIEETDGKQTDFLETVEKMKSRKRTWDNIKEF